jgi:hypothetical protein
MCGTQASFNAAAPVKIGTCCALANRHYTPVGREVPRKSRITVPEVAFA